MKFKIVNRSGHTVHEGTASGESDAWAQTLAHLKYNDTVTVDSLKNSDGLKFINLTAIEDEEEENRRRRRRDDDNTSSILAAAAVATVFDTPSYDSTPSFDSSPSPSFDGGGGSFGGGGDTGSW